MSYEDLCYYLLDFCDERIGKDETVSYLLQIGVSANMIERVGYSYDTIRRQQENLGLTSD